MKLNEKQTNELIGALEEIAHAQSYPTTGEIYGQTIATSMEVLADAMMEIAKQMKISNDMK